VEAYGPEAPGILNKYALNLENVVDSAVAWGKDAQNLLSYATNFAREEVIQGQALMNLLEGTQNTLFGYANTLEWTQNVLFGYAQKLGQYVDAANQLYQENQAYNTILTNPDVLSDYTLKFFGPEGPYPVYQSEAELEYGGPANYGINPAQYIQQMPNTPDPYSREQVANVWEAFDSTFRQDPSNAWRLLNQMPPASFQSKLLVAE
jgi:hypothetical protein